MIGNLETFQDELAASGFPPLVNKLAGADFRGRIATRDRAQLVVFAYQSGLGYVS